MQDCGRLSPSSAVTLPPDARLTAKIPEAAAFFAFAYPLPGFEHTIAELDRKADAALPQTTPSHGSPSLPLPSPSAAGAAPSPADTTVSWLAWKKLPIARFMSTGGFVYWDKELKLVSANALCDGEGLQLEGPMPLPSDQLGATLYNAGRVQRVTLAPLIERGVGGFCWLAAAEAIPGESHWGGEEGGEDRRASVSKGGDELGGRGGGSYTCDHRVALPV